MQVTTPPRTYTVTVTATERDLMRCALLGLAERLHNEVRSAETRAAQGINVQPFLAGTTAELDAVRKMTAALDYAALDYVALDGDEDADAA